MMEVDDSIHSKVYRDKICDIFGIIEQWDAYSVTMIPDETNDSGVLSSYRSIVVAVEDYVEKTNITISTQICEAMD